MEKKVISDRKVALANKDFMGRVSREGLILAYNEDADLMSIIIGTPQEAITEPLLDNVLYRIDPDTLKIVGFEILDFKSDFLPHNRLMQEYFSLIYNGRKISGEISLSPEKLLEAPGLAALMVILM